ncbi:MAG TPA: IPT/TIG domain-containing protein, partial [Cyclobacteriaceae bacterium]|nr:IPT/TIG domain-containing protein [Cyclobacteriaceae bacterium]
SKDSNPKPAPTLSSISQNPISPGGSFSLTGTNFDPVASNNVVKFGTAIVAVASSTSTLLTLTLPAAFSSGSYTVSVTVNGMTAALSGSVDVTPNSPSITSFSPSQNVTGANVMINGVNFDPIDANNIVTFGSSTTSATVVAASSTQLTVTVPASTAAGTYAIHVAVKQNSETSAVANSATNFSVLPNTPTITGFTPAQSSSGSTLVITGTNFSSTMASNNVTFGSISATVTAASTTQLSVTVPQGLSFGSSYLISVSETENGQTSAIGNSSSNFNLAASISDISPASGTKGTTLTINGSFDPGAGRPSVTINGHTASVVTATSSQIVVTVPKGAGTGQVSITANGQITNGPTFNYVLSRDYVVSSNSVLTSISYPTCLDYDSVNNVLYVGNFAAANIVAVNPATGAINNYITPTPAFVSYGIALVSGNLYCLAGGTSINNLYQVNPANSSTTLITNNWNTPIGLSYASGKLYSVEENSPFNVKSVDLNNSNTVTTIGVSAYQPNGTAIDPSGGYLYVSANNQVQKMNISTGAFTTIENNPTYFRAYRDIIGNLYFSKYDESVVLLDPATNTEVTLVSNLSGNGPSYNLRGVVAYFHNNQITVYVPYYSSTGPIYKIVVNVTMD